LKYNFKVIDSLVLLEKLVKHLREQNVKYALDLETSGTDPWRESIVGAGLCWSDKGAVYVPIAHAYDQPFEGREAVEILRPLLIEHQFLAYNALFEVGFLEHDYKIMPSQMPIDVMLLAYSVGLFASISLAFVASKLCKDVGVLDYGTFMASVGLSKVKDSIAVAPVRETAEYCGRDALATFLVHQRLYEKVKNSRMYKMEARLLPFVKSLRDTGVILDTKYMEEECERLTTERDAGTEIEFNINSSKQLGNVLFDILKLRVDKITQGGARSTDQQVMSKLKWKNAIVKKIAIWKEIDTLITKFYTKMEKYVQTDGRIHASYNQAGAPTGRFSCSDPNLQNIAAFKSWVIEEGNKSHEITTNPRKSICVAGTHWLGAFDYSQIEARIAAGVTKEPALVNAFKEGVDFHTKTAYGAEAFVWCSFKRYANNISTGEEFQREVFGSLSCDVSSSQYDCEGCTQNGECGDFVGSSDSYS
jgi:DNA polymerase-1